MDSDGDGVLSFEEFKVLFDNNEKRKESKLAAQNKVSLQNWLSVIFLEMKEKYLIILQQRQLKMWTMNYLKRQQQVVREEMNTESLGRKIDLFYFKLISFGVQTLTNIQPWVEYKDFYTLNNIFCI